MPFPALGPAGSRLDVVVFGPGFGESVVVRTADDEWLVVDSLLHRSVNPALQLLQNHRAVPALALLTHPHADHSKGFAELLRMRGASTIAACARPFHAKGPRGAVPSKRARAARHEEAVTACLTHPAPLRWSPIIEEPAPHHFKRTAVVAMYPPKNPPKASSVNRYATPLRLVFGKTTVVLGSDLSRPGWSDLAKRGVAIAHHGLKIPHHGSDHDHHDGWTAGEPGRCWVMTPWRLGAGALPRLAAERDLQKLLRCVSRLHLTFLGTGAAGTVTLKTARAAAVPKGLKLPKPMRLAAVLDSGRVEESWVWASFDDQGACLSVTHGKDAAIVTP